MTSRYSATRFIGSKQHLQNWVMHIVICGAGGVNVYMMAGISITALSSYFAGEPKSLERWENHYKSDHVESLSYYPGTLTGKVHASMKEKTKAMKLR